MGLRSCWASSRRPHILVLFMLLSPPVMKDFLEADPKHPSGTMLLSFQWTLGNCNSLLQDLGVRLIGDNIQASSPKEQATGFTSLQPCLLLSGDSNSRSTDLSLLLSPGPSSSPPSAPPPSSLLLSRQTDRYRYIGITYIYMKVQIYMQIYIDITYQVHTYT